MKTQNITDATDVRRATYKSTFRVDRYIQQVYDDQLGDDEKEDEKFLIGNTLVFLGLATFEGTTTEENDVETVHRRFKSTKTLQLLMDRKGLFIPFREQEED